MTQYKLLLGFYGTPVRGRVKVCFVLAGLGTLVTTSCLPPNVNMGFYIFIFWILTRLNAFWRFISFRFVTLDTSDSKSRWIKNRRFCFSSSSIRLTSIVRPRWHHGAWCSIKLQLSKSGVNCHSRKQVSCKMHFNMKQLHKKKIKVKVFDIANFFHVSWYFCSTL